MYRIAYKLRNKDVNLYRRLRTSRLMEILQEACIAHTEELGAGRKKTLDQGILWVVIQQDIKIHQMPVYDDPILAETWPGETMHVLFPRYFRIINPVTGSLLIEGSSLWTLIDQKTRKMVFADKYGIIIHGEQTGREIPLPKMPSAEQTDQSASFTVPFSYCDLNGHMNNTRYFDLAEDLLNYARQGKTLSRIMAEYSSEARFNETIEVAWKEDQEKACLYGKAEKPCFRMQFRFTD